MAYRGEDLDLRTPQGWSSSGRDAGSGEQANWWTRATIYKGGRGDPIWVDDSVMACCNHAYDLALAHRAPEVRLEHLINALTLNEHAAQILDARGLSVASLRRESGAAIANDIPASGTAQGAPKRSEAVEEALRLAADHAYPRRTPVTVDDMLHVLFDMKRDLPGLQMLQRHATAWNGRAGSDVRLDPLPPTTRPTPAPAPRYVAPAAHDYFAQPTPIPREPSPREPLPREPLSRDIKREPPIVRETPLSRDPVRTPRDSTPLPTIDLLQDNRLDSLERAVRDLGVDLADERKTLRSLVSDLQRSTTTQADDASRFRGGLSERLAQIEDSVHRSRSEAASLPSTLLDRLAAMERGIDARLAEASRTAQPAQALLDRMAAIERNIEIRLADLGRNGQPSQLMLDRLAQIEHSLDARLADVARLSQPGAGLYDKLASLERILENRLLEVGQLTSALIDRVKGLEGATQRPVEATLSPLVSQRLDAMTAFAGKVDSLERTFQMLLDRLTGIERRLESTPEVKPIDLSAVEKSIAGLDQNLKTTVANLDQGLKATVAQSFNLAPLTDLLSGVEARISGFERSLDNRTAETGRTVSFIGERLRAFEEAIGGQRTQTVDRLGQIEKSLTAFAESAVASGGGHERDLGEVHDALLKLNANQQTLAGTLDQWRLENSGDLSVINNRLKAIEESELRSTPLAESLAQQVAAVHAALAKREVRKSRFRHWLFGTDEWYSASYDTRRWRARQVDPQPARTGDVIAAPIVHRGTPPAPPPSQPTALRR